MDKKPEKTQCFHCFACSVLIGYDVGATLMDQNKTEVHRRLCRERFVQEKLVGIV